MATTGRATTRWGRGLRPGALAALAVTAALATLAIAGGRSVADEAAPADEVVDREIAGLLESGVSEDDPKIEALREDLERAPREAGQREPAALVEADRQRLADQPDHDVGRVRCDVVPPDLLTVDDIEGATCVVAPQPDGTARYAAIGPDGIVRTVRFGGDGPTRLANGRARLPEGAEVEVSDAGAIRITGPGGERAVIEFD